VRTAASKIGALDEIARHREDARQAGRRVALVTGRFDVMTDEVAAALEAARGKADVLIVALRRMRDPLVADDDRALLVAALRIVDHVLVVSDGELGVASTRLSPDTWAVSPEEPATRALLERLRR
jgi:bifunctional ADP-heptose synthase (sugar kinase/adenylyltransferase)